MPTPYPPEFRRDVIAIARQGDQSISQVAKSFGISQSCLSRWLRIADREDGLDHATGVPATATPAATGAASDLEAENRELRKRTKQLEQELEEDVAEDVEIRLAAPSQGQMRPPRPHHT